LLESSQVGITASALVKYRWSGRDRWRWSTNRDQSADPSRFLTVPGPSRDKPSLSSRPVTAMALKLCQVAPQSGSLQAGNVGGGWRWWVGGCLWNSRQV